MQKRFTPDAGGVFPEWEEIEFGKLFQRRSEKNGEEFGVDKTISVATMHFKPEGNKADEKSLPKYKVMRTGDIAFEGHINKHFKHGRFVLNDIGDGIISPIFEVLQPVSELSKEVPGFWKYYINYEPVMGKILAKCANTGIMMNRLSIKDFYKQKIKVPCIEEQRKIAAALAAYDEMIAVKTAKLETWQECKKRMVKEIFGRTKRFKDDDGMEFPGWEEKTLGEVAELKNGFAFSAKSYDKDNSGDYRIITIGNLQESKNIVISNKTKTVLKAPENIKEHQVLKNGDILVALTGATAGRVALNVGINNLLNQRVGKLQIKDTANVDNEFLYHIVSQERFEKEMKKKGHGSAQPNLSKCDVEGFSFSLPCIEEQQKIGNFLAEIDKEIEIQKEFIKTYSDGKKRMMMELMGWKGNGRVKRIN